MVVIFLAVVVFLIVVAAILYNANRSHRLWQHIVLLCYVMLCYVMLCDVICLFVQ